MTEHSFTSPEEYFRLATRSRVTEHSSTAKAELIQIVTVDASGRPVIVYLDGEHFYRHDEAMAAVEKARVPAQLTPEPDLVKLANEIWADPTFERIHAALKVAQQTLDSNLHPDTRALIEKLSHALTEKLRKAELKYGYSNGWLTDDWEYKCRSDLRLHLEKGDPLDVIAYAAFMWARGWSTNPPTKLRRPTSSVASTDLGTPVRAADGNSYRYHATGLPAGGDKPESSR